MGVGPERAVVYTGKTGKPCCLCGRESTDVRVDLPPRAVPAMKHAGPIAWRDIVGEVSLHFCGDDWATVRDLVLETGMSPLGRCNAARADFDLRADFEALLNDTRETAHDELEARMQEASDATLSDPDATDRDRVEALLVRWTLDGEVGANTGDPDGTDAGDRSGGSDAGRRAN